MAEEQPSAAQDDIQIKTEPEDVDPCNENDFAKGPHPAPSGVKCAGTSPRTNQSGVNKDIGEVVVNLKDDVSIDDPGRTILWMKQEDICDGRIEQKNLRIRPVRVVLVDLKYKHLAKKGLNANKDGGHMGWSSNRLRSCQQQSRTNYTEISSDHDEEVEGEDKDPAFQEFSSEEDEDMDEDVDSVDSSFDELDPGSDSVDQQRSNKFYKGLIRYQALGKFTEFPAETLNKMVKQGSSEYSMVCTVCNKKWKVISVMARHVQAHARGRNFSCLKCGRDFRAKQWYDLHCELHLQGLWQENDKPGSRQHTCQLCHRIFPSQASLFLHRKKHHQEEEPWRCGCCQKTFKGPGQRQKHEMAHLTSQGQVFECSECDESFKSQHALWDHRVTHMFFNPDTKIYSCDKCSAKYRSPNSMVRHRLTHSFEAVCKKCGRHIGKRYNLAAHEKHCNGAEKKAKRFQCEYCGKVFKYNFLLKRHRTIHTGEKKPPRFQCEHCGKCFELKLNLQRHVLIHTGDRPFECKHCGLKFNQNTARDRHVKLHFKHGEYRDVIKHHVKVKKGRDGRQYQAIHPQAMQIQDT